MEQKLNSIYFLRLIPTTFLCFFLFTGCATFSQNEDNVVLRDAKSIEPTVQEIARGNIIHHSAMIKDLENLHEYALLSAHIYEDDKGSDIKCDKSNSKAWKLMKKFNDSSLVAKPEWDFEISGFQYAVWEKTGDRAKPLVAIVFRGSDPEGGDWFSNLRWVTRFIPFTWDHYDQTRDLIPNLVTRIRDHYSYNVEIIATGHSLGGGLAQQAAYMSEHIQKVYAYDSSSVTGYYSITDTKLRKQSEKGLSIYRIYEHGEVLAYLRWFMKKVYPIAHENPRIVEVRYNLITGNIFSQHNMKNFACKLKEISDQTIS